MTIPILLLLLLVGLIGVGGLGLMATYNGLVTLRQTVKNAWAQIDVQLNLVNTVKGYAAHEKETFERVINARAKATSATSPAEVIKAEGELSSALARLLAVSESYPELKANQNFLSLQEELTSTENRVAYARQFYNDSVTRLNTRIQTFPTVVIAGMFGFKEEPFFETPSEEKEAPRVQF